MGCEEDRGVENSSITVDGVYARYVPITDGADTLDITLEGIFV